MPICVYKDHEAPAVQHVTFTGEARDMYPNGVDLCPPCYKTWTTNLDDLPEVSKHYQHHVEPYTIQGL